MDDLMQFNKLTDQTLIGKRVLIRVDMNVPVKNGVRRTWTAGADNGEPNASSFSGPGIDS